MLVGHLRLERPGLERELPELEPVAEQPEEGRRRHGESGKGSDGRRPGEVEPDDPGSVAPNDEQAELFPAGSAWTSGTGAGPRGPGGCLRRLSQTVHARFLGNHEGPEGASAVPEVRHELSRVWMTPPCHNDNGATIHVSSGTSLVSNPA